MRFTSLLAATILAVFGLSASAQQGGNPNIPRPNIPQPPRPGVQTPQPGVPRTPRIPQPNIPNIPRPNIPTTPSIPNPNIPTTPSVPQPTIPTTTVQTPNIPTTTQPNIPDVQPPTMPDMEVPSPHADVITYECTGCGGAVGEADTSCPHCGARFDYVENPDGSRTEIPTSPGERTAQIGIGILVLLGLGAKLFLRR